MSKRKWDWERYEKDFVNKAIYKEENNKRTILKSEISHPITKSKTLYTRILLFLKIRKVKYFLIGFITILFLELILILLNLV